MQFADCLPGKFRPRLTVWASGIDCYYADCMEFGSRTYPVDLDIGELADGHHLIVRNIAVSGNLVVDWVLVPEPAEEADLWPEIRYDADVSPSGWNGWRADFDVFERPVPKARKVWFDFFRPYYEWYAHLEAMDSLMTITCGTE